MVAKLNDLCLSKELYRKHMHNTPWNLNDIQNGKCPISTIKNTPEQWDTLQQSDPYVNSGQQWSNNICY